MRPIRTPKVSRRFSFAIISRIVAAPKGTFIYLSYPNLKGTIITIALFAAPSVPNFSVNVRKGISWRWTHPALHPRQSSGMHSRFSLKQGHRLVRQMSARPLLLAWQEHPLNRLSPGDQSLESDYPMEHDFRICSQSLEHEQPLKQCICCS
jgi:hypothetical protein